MKASELIRSHRYVEAIAELKRDLDKNPEDMAAVEGMAKALRAKGENKEALLFFDRLAQYESDNKTANTLAPGRALWQIEIA